MFDDICYRNRFAEAVIEAYGFVVTIGVRIFAPLAVSDQLVMRTLTVPTAVLAFRLVTTTPEILAKSKPILRLSY